MSLSMQRINSALNIREDYLSKFEGSSIANCWEALGKLIKRNYDLGKATSVPKLGYFTYSFTHINMMGTTNQLDRDKRPKEPLFIVSQEFEEKTRPGISTSKGIIPLEYRPSEAPECKVNYVEIALGLGLDKLQVREIIEHSIKYMSESIQKGIFKNKTLPHVGFFLYKSNLLAFKFDSSLQNSISYIPHQVSLARKLFKPHIEVGEINDNNTTYFMKEKKQFLLKSYHDLRPKRLFYFY